MKRPSKWINHPFHADPAGLASHMAGALLAHEMDAHHQPLPQARRALARRLHCAPGTLETLARRRMKHPRGFLMDALCAAYARLLETQIRNLSDELEHTRAFCAVPAPELLAVETALAQASARLDQLRGAA